MTAIENITGEESAVSNRDSIIFSRPLSLPYFNDFENNNIDEWGTNNTTWGQSTFSHSENYSFSNKYKRDHFNNFLAIAELCWFQIPEATTNVNLSFYLKASINGIGKNANAFIEITTDRRRWNKLLKTSGNSDWVYYTFSLNDYIGEPFTQLRIRIESFGNNYYGNPKHIYIDDIAINFQSFPAPKNARITNYSDSLQRTVIEWDAVTVPTNGYNIYRDSIKINNEPVTETKYDDNNALSDKSCYHITAVYPELESNFSNKACISDIGIETILLTEFKIFPNPSSGIFTVKTGLQTPYTITIYNINGSKIYQKLKFIDGKLDLSNLPKGSYFLNIINGQSSFSKKIIIQ